MLNDEKRKVTYVPQTMIEKETLFLEVRDYIFTNNNLLPEIWEFMKLKTHVYS